MIALTLCALATLLGDMEAHVRSWTRPDWHAVRWRCFCLFTAGIRLLKSARMRRREAQTQKSKQRCRASGRGVESVEAVRDSPCHSVEPDAQAGPTARCPNGSAWPYMANEMCSFCEIEQKDRFYVPEKTLSAFASLTRS
ncbi:MAG: hypothetical protein ACLUMK_12495 [Christensenellales bacterium]